MDAVKSFNAELSSLYEVKPPISKAKMTAITRGAIKAIKFYKHVVQSVEKFILKCKPEYKVPGLYVIDSIVRQSRHQFGADKDVFAPRFAKNMRQTFINLFACPPEDKSKIIRVLNLWQKNQVFAPEVIQPLFDLADPNNPIHKELSTTASLQSNGVNANTSVIKGSPALQKTPTKGSQQAIDGAHLGGTNLNLSDPSVIAHLQQLQRLLSRGNDQSKSETVHFDRKLLDFDYGDEDDEVHSTPKTAPNDSVSSLLTNPEVLRQLQTLQQTMTSNQNNELDIDKLRKLQEMKQQEEEFDKHLAQTVPNLPFAAECEFKPGNSSSTGGNYYLPTGADLSQPPPGYKPPPPPPQSYDIAQQPQQQSNNDVQFVSQKNDSSNDVEIINLDHGDSTSPSPNEDRYNRRRRSRSRDRSRDRRDRDRRSRRSRSRSRSRRHRSRSRERNRGKEKETEKDKERKKRGLPAIKKENLSVCSTTLWVGHLSKLVHQEDLSNTFGEFGDIVSIDLIPPRGCAFIVMHRRQDAARCLTKLKNYVLHGKAITLAWAPGKGVKGKDLKDYWEGDLGVSYIPWSKLKPDIDLEMLEDGGMIDEDTMPPWMKARIANQTNQQNTTDTTNFMQLPTDLTANTVDTSQPPPVPGTGLLQPPPPMALPMVSPFQFNNRLLAPVGMNIPPTMLPNVPIGVPPPSALMQNQIVGLGSPFQNTTNLMQQMSVQQNNDKNQNQNNDIKSLSETLMSMAQPFGVLQPPTVQNIAMQQSQQNDDNMDIEMEDVEKIDRPMSLSEQLQASLNQFANNQVNRPNSSGLGNDMDMDNRQDIRGERDRRSRDRDRDRIRDRDRSRNSRDDYRDDRSRDRKDDRRDRPNRWGDREHDLMDRREREKTLNDRLQQMANDGMYLSSDDRLRDRNNQEAILPSLLDNRRIFLKPHKNPNDLDDTYNMSGGVPPTVDDYDQNPLINPIDGPLLDDFNPVMDHPDFHDGGGMMHSRMRRDDYDNERFMRGRRIDFRDNFDVRMRGHLGGPPAGPDFYPMRDNYGPGPRPLMRGGPDFMQRPSMMRGPPTPHKFHPRNGPPPRGPRSGRPGFGPRFDHPDFHRGPPGGMFDDPPHHMRHRSSSGGGGGRFDDRRRSRQDYHDNSSQDNDRNYEKRSRWSGGSPKSEDTNQEQDQSQQESERDNTNDDDESVEYNERNNKGCTTPLHDEPFNQSMEKNQGNNSEDTASLVLEKSIDDNNTSADIDQETRDDDNDNDDE